MTSKWIVVVVMAMLLVMRASANQAIGGEEEKPTDTPTKPPIDVSDQPVYIEKEDANVTMVEPITIKITTSDSTTWDIVMENV